MNSAGKTSPRRDGLLTTWTSPKSYSPWRNLSDVADWMNRGTRDPAALLQGLGLVKDGHILRAAVALFGDNERVGREMTQSLLRVARFRGLDRTADFLDNRQFRGNAFTLLKRAERFLIENLPVASRVIPNRFARVDEPLYPPEALREALANAICHRDYAIGGGSVGVAIYDDRLEVTSTGPLHFGLTPEKLFAPHESQPWNPLIAGAFYRRGIIEQWGRGTIKMAELTESAGLPRPEIADSGGGVTVTFRPSQYIPPQRAGRDLTERQQAILVLLHNSGGGMAARDIRAELDPQIGDRQLSRDLDTLRTLELVSLTGHGRGANGISHKEGLWPWTAFDVLIMSLLWRYYVLIRRGADPVARHAGPGLGESVACSDFISGKAHRKPSRLPFPLDEHTFSPL